jgi:TetR/AcrR family transcriptional regulator, cholesterol catabolism regulator
MSDVLETKEHVIKAAVDLFSRKGFNGTSIRDIANAMGMSISNIYHYFGNKEGLMLAILQDSSERLYSSLQKVTQAKIDPLDRFKLLVETHVRLSEEFRKESKIFFIEEDHLSAEGREKNHQIQREFLNLYLNELRTLKELGYVQSENLTVLAFNVLGVIVWLLRWYDPGGPLSLDDISKEIISFVIHGLSGSRPAARPQTL